MAKKLDTREGIEPIDVLQCQAIRLEGSFMSFGPPRQARCEQPPDYIAVEREPHQDGLRGAMSLCEECSERFLQQLGEGHADLYRITQETTNKG